MDYTVVKYNTLGRQAGGNEWHPLSLPGEGEGNPTKIVLGLYGVVSKNLTLFTGRSKLCDFLFPIYDLSKH